MLQVWIISRHYSDDQRMGSLFQRIAREIGDRVEAAIDLRQMFRMAPAEAVELLRVCKNVLEHWYLQVSGCGSGHDAQLPLHEIQLLYGQLLTACIS